MFNNPFPESRTVYEMWKNMVEPDDHRWHIIRRRKGDLHAELLKQEYKQALITFNTYCSSATTMVTRTRLDVTLYVHILSCYSLAHPHFFFCFSDVSASSGLTSIAEAFSIAATFEEVNLFSLYFSRKLTVL